MNKIATLVGCAVGDALGMPFEMKSPISPALVEWDGLFKAGGTFWKGNAGQWTDDTKMTVALASSLVECKGFDPANVAQKYLDWYNSGNTRGIGSTTAEAMVNLKLGATWNKSGITKNENGQPAAGNGTAMRASPIGLFYHNNLSKQIEVAAMDAIITHNSIEAIAGSTAVALGTALSSRWILSLGADPLSYLDQILDTFEAGGVSSVVREKLILTRELAISAAKGDIKHTEALARIGTRGYVPETVGAAFYCFCSTGNFKDCVIMAVKAGGDTDTTAAVAGAIAGTFYGLEGIGAEYHSVEDFDLLQKLTDDLVELGK